MKLKPLALLAVAGMLALSGCAVEQEDISTWMRQQERMMRGGVKPLPEMRTFPEVNYEVAHLVSPFETTRIQPEHRADVVQGGPDLTRPREPLESYPLESIAMVGVLMQEERIEALLSVTGTVHQVRVGNYIGQDHGMITKIEETELTLVELVEDMNGDWVERTSKLLLQEQ